MLVKKEYKKIKIIVLKPSLTYDEAKHYINQKKTNPFRNLLRKPKKNEVHLHSLEIIYEPYMKILGKYSSDFFRKSVNSIKVDQKVREVKIGNGTFPASDKSLLIKKIQGRHGKNIVNLELEEHVFVENKKEIVLDHHGFEGKALYKSDSKYIEKFPEAAITKHETKEIEITPEAAIKKFSDSFKEDIQYETRNLNEKLTIDEITKIYVPIYEARLIGPKNKEEILRVDGVTKKII